MQLSASTLAHRFTRESWLLHSLRIRSYKTFSTSKPRCVLSVPPTIVAVGDNRHELYHTPIAAHVRDVHCQVVHAIRAFSNRIVPDLNITDYVMLQSDLSIRHGQ